MAVKTNAIITVNNRKSIVNKDLWCYEDDKNIDIYFMIEDERYEVISEEQSLKYYSFTIIKPNGLQIDRNELMPIETNHIKLKIDGVSDFDEVGKYIIQIHLYDTNDINTRSEFKIPEVNFEIVSRAKGKDAVLLNENSINLLTENENPINYNGNLGIKISEMPELNNYTGNGYTPLNYEGTTYRVNIDKVLNKTVKDIDEKIENNTSEIEYIKTTYGEEYIIPNIVLSNPIIQEYILNSGQLISKNGNGVPQNTNMFKYSVTNNINVCEGELYEINASNNWGNAIVVLYNQDGTVIPYYSDNIETLTIFNKVLKIPSGITSMRVCPYGENFSIIKSSKYGFIAESSIETITLDRLEDKLKNIFNIDNSTTVEIPLNFTFKGQFVNKDGVIKEFSTVNRTDYIDISSQDVLRFTGETFSDSVACVFFDKNKKITGYLNGNYKDSLINVPKYTNYIMINDNSIHENKLTSELYSIYSYAINNTKWSNKKWLIIGDSITEKNIRTTINYHDYISQQTGIEVTNFGVGGTGYKANYNGRKDTFYERVLKITGNYDVVTIFGGGNDLAYKFEIGTPSDITTDTICGCVNKTIDNLYSVLPTVQLGIIAPTPWGSFNPSDKNNKMNILTGYLKEICENRSIPFLDLYHYSNLRPWDNSFLPLAFSKDNGNSVHPDETGHKLFAPRIKEFLNSLIL